MKYESEKQQNNGRKTTAVDMTEGFIPKLLISFCIPLILGNFFQVLYNTVDTLVVGNFIGKEALAAVGGTSTIINMAVFAFNGVAVGFGVVIGQYFGAKDFKKLHDAVETTMTLTLVCSVVFTVLFSILAPNMLRWTHMPDDVIGQATTYLRIYFAGISGLLIYNMGAGILRAVGDSRRPLMFLIFSSFLNTILDLVFVLVFRMGIAGAAFATIVSQGISAILVLYLLTSTRDVYQLVWKDLHFDLPILGRILAVGLPAGMQSMITAFANTFMQAYINAFGSAVIAGWGCFLKHYQIVMLPMQSMSHAATTFVSQNIGAKKVSRANRGGETAILMMVIFDIICSILMYIYAAPLIRIFSKDASVISNGALFMRTDVVFFVANGVVQVLAGAIRGRGDSKGPMIIMLSCYVVIRQIYLFLISRACPGRPELIGLGFPVGWIICCILELTYYYIRYRRKQGIEESAENR